LRPPSPPYYKYGAQYTKDLIMDELIQVDNGSLRGAWADMVAGFADWSAFYTLTFSDKDRNHAVSRDESLFLWRRLVQSLNRRLFGNSYTRIVGHSYFSYALAFEYQSRGAIHMHALVDNVTDWEYINTLWRSMAGIAKIKPVHDKDKVAKYLCKYVTKGGDVLLYRAVKGYKQPAFKPMWYLEATEKLKAHSAE